MNQATTYLKKLSNPIVEVRILRERPYLQREYVGNTISGYYDADNFDKISDDIQRFDADSDTKGIYNTLHRLDSSLLHRSSNKLKLKAELTSSDHDVTHFSTFPIDFDPERPSGISSSEIELSIAKKVMTEIKDMLIALGIPESAMIKAMSGNGCHLQLLIEPFENTDENADRFKQVGDLVAQAYKADATIYNPSRIFKLYGTTGRKGDNTEERPHRASWCAVPETPYRIPFQELEDKVKKELASTAETTVGSKASVLTPQPTGTQTGVSHDGTLEEWLDAKGVHYKKVAYKNGCYKYQVDCPHNVAHKLPDAWLTDEGGKWQFACSHDSCKRAGNNTWDAFRNAIGHPKKEHGGSRKGAGRKSNIEKAKEAQPVKSQKPIIMLNEIIFDDESGKDVLSDKGRHEISDEVASVLFKTSKDDNFFRRGLELGSLKPDNDTLRFNAYTKEGIGGVIARQVSLQKYLSGEIVKVANPPSWLASDILENQDTSKLPAIDIILSHPYHNGQSLVTENGFDANTGAYLNQKTTDLDLDLEAHSAKDDVFLWKDWLRDFPFESEADFENAIAYMLTILVRPGFPTGEVSPMFLITAPREGVGKTLLADVLTAAVTGVTTETRTLSSSNDDIKKELGASLRGAPEVIVFDNVESSKRLDSAVLASIVTQVRGRFRILGMSEEMAYENRATMMYTGSNIEMTIELVKRAVAIRLSDPGIAEKDREVAVESILFETLQRHSEFISSLARMVKRWIESEKENTDPLHRMRHWSKVIFAILKANSHGEHFLKNTDKVMLTTGGEFTTWSNAYKSIVEQLGEQAVEGFTASDVFTTLSHEDNVYSPEKAGKHGETVIGKGDNILGEYITGNKEHSRKVTLGKLLRGKVGSIFGGYKLIDTHRSARGNQKIYRLEPIEGQNVPRIPGSEPELEVPEHQESVNSEIDCPF